MPKSYVVREVHGFVNQLPLSECSSGKKWQEIFSDKLFYLSKAYLKDKNGSNEPAFP